MFLDALQCMYITNYHNQNTTNHGDDSYDAIMSFPSLTITTSTWHNLFDSLVYNLFKIFFVRNKLDLYV